MAVFKLGHYTQWSLLRTHGSILITTWNRAPNLFRSGMEQHEFELYYIRKSIHKQKAETPAYRTKLLTQQPVTKYGITE
jgi:hypothetical protein